MPVRLQPTGYCFLSAYRRRVAPEELVIIGDRNEPLITGTHDRVRHRRFNDNGDRGFAIRPWFFILLISF